MDVSLNWLKEYAPFDCDMKTFAELMTTTAKTFGARNTSFVNANGLHDKNHYTTAYDLAKITAYALNNPIFKEIVSCKLHIVEETNKSDKRYMSNKNKLFIFPRYLLYFFIFCKLCLPRLRVTHLKQAVNSLRLT